MHELVGIVSHRKGKLSYEEDSARQEESLVPQLNWEFEGKRARACSVAALNSVSKI